MIQANEVRVSNWYYDAGGYFRQMTPQTPIALCMQHWRPIEISPEILEKAGFEKGNHNSFINGKYLLSMYMRGWFMTYTDPNDRGSECIAYPQYLHQLQNLYFALTGEELTVNL